MVNLYNYMLGVGKRPSSTFIDPDGYIKTAHKCLIDELNEIYTLFSHNINIIN